MEDQFPPRSFMNKPNSSNQRLGLGSNPFSNQQKSQIRSTPPNIDHFMPQEMGEFPPGIGPQYHGNYYYPQVEDQSYIQPQFLQNQFERAKKPEEQIYAQPQFPSNQFERAKKPEVPNPYAASSFPQVQFERAKKPITHETSFPQNQFERTKIPEDQGFPQQQFAQNQFERAKKPVDQPYPMTSFPGVQFERAKKPLDHDTFGQSPFERAKEQSFIPQQYMMGQFENVKKSEESPYASTSFPAPQFDQGKKTSNPETFSQKLREKFGKASTSSSDNTASYKPPQKNIMEAPNAFEQSVASTNYTDNFSSDNYPTSGIAFQTSSYQPSFEKPIMKPEPPGMVNPLKIENDDAKERKGTVNPTEDIMNAIFKNQINCVSLLNEVGSKVKKRVDYIMKEVPMGKIKAFECTCVLDKQEIGAGRGNSKQAAKTDSANEGVRTLLTKEEFTFEKAHITLSVQKMTGVGTAPEPIPSNPAPKVEVVQENPRAIFSQQELDIEANKSLAESSESALMNDSALYELNLIAKECFIEPKWVMSPPGGPNGEFEAQVVFDKLVAIGKGRKKLDAKRDAALKIIQQIRLSKELTERYNPKAKKKLSPSASVLEIAKNDQRKVFFENCLDPRILQELQNESQAWRERITKLQKSFGDYLDNLMRKYALEEDTIDILHEFYKRATDYTEIVTSSPKQIMLDAPKHLADYVTDCSLVPIGSFALDCMRNDRLSINVLVIFQEIKKISEKEFLELYRNSLVECQKIVLREHSSVTMKMEFSVEDSDIGNYLLVTTNTAAGNLTMQIQVSNLSQEKEKSLAKRGDPSIIHIKRIYDCFEESERLNQFRNLMGIMRLWRVRNNLVFLSPELMDAVLLNEFLNNKAGVVSGYIINCLIVMSAEETFQAALAKCGTYYTKLYKEIPSKMKWTISSKCSQSLEAIYKEDFEESYFL